MHYMLDFLFLIVFALTIFVSAKRGFFASLIDLGAFVISLVAAKVFSQSLAPLIYQSSFEAPLRDQVAASLGKVGVTDYAAQIEATLRALPDPVAGVMELLGIRKEELLEKLSNSPLAGKNMIDNIMANVVSPAAVAVIRTVLFVIIALVVCAALRAVCMALNGLIKKLPAIRQVNTGLGVVLGVLRGLLVVFLAALLLNVIAGFTANEAFIAAVQNSVVENAARGFLTSISGYITPEQLASSASAVANITSV